MANRNAKGALNGTRPGFQVPKRSLTFGLEGEEYVGAEITASDDISLGEYLRMKDTLTGGEGLLELAEQFGDKHLQGWNLVDQDSHPIPANGEGMLSLPLFVSIRIVSAWLSALVEAPIPLEAPSNVGSTLAAASTAMGS